ncbi:VanW family protein [Oceanirhabdus sp. W0125-5]|uniref:VanW family protein n=1 Tax=Oceanirhabdus sp. W0125-5 TaxID=2999116 RepID=UPI0022F341F6|nr:VanW family protein [Oceanirhabdus sp. W0125-5]WBW97566.1 VanW family protein [Oceanirhabdus sp. W0125-5]
MKKLSPFKLIIIIIIPIFLIIFSYYLYVTSTINNYNALIYPGVNINGIDVSSLDKNSAIQKIQSHFEHEVIERKVTYLVEDKEYSLRLSDLNPEFNYEETIDLALSYGKDLSLFNKYNLIKTPEPKTYDLIVKYDTKPLTTITKKILEETSCDPINATIKREDEKFIITEDSQGKSIDYEELINTSLAQFRKSSVKDVVIDVKINYISPSITAAELRQINGLISTFTTRLSGSSPERVTNVTLATNKVSNTLLMPQDEFSFNKTIGSVNEANGYRESKVIINNKLVPGIGGGICQVSSTLYNAILRSNILPTERHHHTLPSTYVPLGLDATVSSNYLDYKFINTLTYPILITGYVTNNKSVTFNVYSCSKLTETQYSILTDVTDVIPNKTRYVKDPTRPMGSQEIDVKGTKGYKVDVFLVSKKGGQVIDKTLIHKDFYKPVDKIIKQGTKKSYPAFYNFRSRDPFNHNN